MGQEAGGTRSGSGTPGAGASGLSNVTPHLWYRRLTLALQQNRGICINHKTVLRLMRKLNIRSVARKPKVHKKLEEIGIYHKYPNLLNRDFAASHPNQKWVTDVTYIRTQQGWAYLSTIKDLYDGFIVGHAFSQSNSIALVTATIRQAQQTQKVTAGLILHSDQGHQYTSQAYQDVLTQEYNISPSMSRRGNGWDNAPAGFSIPLKRSRTKHPAPYSNWQTSNLLIPGCEECCSTVSRLHSKVQAHPASRQGNRAGLQVNHHPVGQ